MLRNMRYGVAAGAVFALAGLFRPGFAASPPTEIKRCVGAATAFLKSLSPEQRARTLYAFDNPARQAFTYRPGVASRTEGIRTGELLEPQRMRLHDLLSCGLSSQGYQKALAIIRRDDLTAQSLREAKLARPGARAETGREFYWMTIFGEPDLTKPWAWQFEGHHLALNFTAAKGSLSVTPAFMGAYPAVMVKGTWAGYRVLDGELVRGLELMESLTPEQRQRAVLSAELPESTFSTLERREALQKFEGIPASALDDTQRAFLRRLIDEYVRNAEPGAAGRLLASIENAGLDKVYFAWMGPVERGQPAYYRVHGPAIIIEFGHAADILAGKAPPDINHIHTYWHVPGDDFGAGLLPRGAASGR